MEEGAHKYSKKKSWTKTTRKKNWVCQEILARVLPLHCYHCIVTTAFTVSTTTTVSCIFNVVVVWLIVFASTTSITFRTFSFACTALRRTGNTEAQEKQEQKTQEKENTQNNNHHQIFWCHGRRDGASKIFGGLCGSRFWAGKFLTAAAATLFDRPLLLLTDLCFFLSSLLTSLYPRLLFLSSKQKPQPFPGKFLLVPPVPYTRPMMICCQLTTNQLLLVFQIFCNNIFN